MLTDPSPRASRATRQALTVALIEPGRGSSSYQAKNSSSPRLQTLFVMGEETLSSTRAFSRRQSAVLFATAISLISVLLMGHIGSHVDLTSGWWRHQAKLARTRRESYGMGVALWGDGRKDHRLTAGDGVDAGDGPHRNQKTGAEGRPNVDWNPLKRQGLLVWAPGCKGGKRYCSAVTVPGGSSVRGIEIQARSTSRIFFTENS